MIDETKRKRDPHVAILEASEAGRGVHFTADEVAYLIQDDAIVTRAHWVRDHLKDKTE